MFASLFQSSTLPVLEQVVGFTQARHGVLAGNIANLDTPGYLTRDLSPEKFQEKLKDALKTRDRAIRRRRRLPITQATQPTSVAPRKIPTTN